MTAAASLELTIVAGSIGAGTLATIVALRCSAAARIDRLALRLARAREAAFVDAARRLADASRMSVEAVREEIARAARTFAPAVDGILMYEVADEALVCSFASGERMKYFTGSQIARDDGAALPVRALLAGHRVSLAGDGVRPIHPNDLAAVALPLGRNAVLAFCARRPLAPDAVDRLATLADQAAPAYHIARERERDRFRAEYDALTGLLTPRAFRQRLAALLEHARFLPNQRLALLFIDTDRFKQWNDRYGHAAGDALLRRLAETLRAAARSERDLVARNGGDEFCLVLAETDKATAIEHAEALRTRLRSLDVASLRPDDPAAVTITASIGVAAFPGDATNANDLLERADEAMYHSKRTGRDAVSYAGVDGALTRLEFADAR